MKSPDQRPISQPEEKPKKSGLRRFMLPAVLGIGAFISSKIPEDAPHVHEPLKQLVEKELSFDSLKDVFRPEVQIQGDRVIIQVDQWHHKDSSKAKSELSAGGIQKIIESQKNVEKAIRFFIEKHGIRDFFVETINAENQLLFDRLVQDIQHFNEDISAGVSERMVNYIGAMADLRETFKTDPTKSDLDRGTIADFMLCRVNDLLTAQHQGKIRLTTVEAEKLEKLRSDLEQDPMIANDMSYLWGAPYRMLARGEITFHRVEDESLAARIRTLMNQLESLDAIQLKTQTDKEKIAALEADLLKTQNLREDAMVRFMLKYLQEHPDCKAAIVVLGGSHFLKGNLRAQEAVGNTQDIGLIKLYNLADERFLETISKNPRYIIPDLRDEADKEK